jgi:hypothetical protein
MDATAISLLRSVFGRLASRDEDIPRGSSLFPGSIKRIGFALAVLLLAIPASAATHSSRNFTVTAPTEEIAKRVANCAEFWRRDLAIQWLGKPLPNWYRPCPISVKVGQMGAGGSTTFTFDKGEVFGWRMEVQGSLERILDSVIPHEVNHTIFASYFRRPLPRWADEGAATIVEHESEKARQVRFLERAIQTNSRIPLKELLHIREYPRESQKVLTLYAQGYSLAEFLVGRQGERGKAVYLKFLDDAHKQGWEQAIRKHYGFDSISSLERDWTEWVLAGSPSLDLPEGQALADASRGQRQPAPPNNAPRNADDVVIRSQTPAEPEPLPMIERPLRKASSERDVSRSEPSQQPGTGSHPHVPVRTAAGNGGRLQQQLARGEKRLTSRRR